MSATQPLYTSSRVQVAVYNKYLKKATELNVRKNPYLAAMEAKKRISYGWSKKGPGLEFEWPIAYKGLTAQPYADMEPVGASRTNVWVRAKLPWRGYVSKESISLLEKKINAGGDTSIFRIEEKLYPLQVKAIMDLLGKDIVGNDGNSTSSDSDGAYNERIHGFPSFLTTTGSTVADNSGAGICADPNDSYGGLSTALANKGGSWTAPTGLEWPEGSGSYEYSYWSPMVIDVESSRFTGDGTTWGANYKYAFLFAITYLESRFNEKWDAFFLSPYALRMMKENLEAATTTNLFVKRGPEESLLTKLGFNPISYEGVDVMSDHNIKAANRFGFGVVFDKMELRCLDDQLIQKSTDSNMDVQADIIAANNFCNLSVESPAFVCEFAGGITEA